MRLLRIVTEIELRDLYKIQPFQDYMLEEGIRLTPAAQQFISDRRINLMRAGAQKRGGLKPEDQTHIKGDSLVRKNHSTIKFRGKIDSTEAEFLLAITEMDERKQRELAEELRIIARYLRKVQKAEATTEELSFIDFYGWNPDEVREKSHQPEKHFGVKHFFPKAEHGREMAVLNRLRTQLRELELSAIDALWNETAGCADRGDIILSLNRLSSILYIMMCRLMGGTYVR